MKDYSFHRGSPQPGAQFLFNQLDHLQLQSRDGWESFYALRNSTGERVILVHFHIQGNVARSPLSAPYSPVEISNARLEVVFEFFTFVLAELRQSGVTSIIIKDPPSIFRPDEAAVLQVMLLKLGFVVKRAEIGSTIVVQPGPLTVRMADWELRKLKQSINADLKFTSLPSTRIGEVYNFIAECRAQKNYPISMTRAQVAATVQKFPLAFHLFAVCQKEVMAAACIAVSVKEDILYTFYFDHHKDFDQLSPAVMLIDGVYDYAQQRQVKFLDLGTSSKDGWPNFGLLQFKIQLGATPSSCITFEKTIG